MARLGEMTAGAAHELNNPLTVISARAQALATRVREDRDRAAAETIVEACTRLSGLIERLNRENGQTFVLVTHDPRVAERAQRILRMRDGCIEAEERPDRAVHVPSRAPRLDAIVSRPPWSAT